MTSPANGVAMPYARSDTPSEHSSLKFQILGYGLEFDLISRQFASNVRTISREPNIKHQKFLPLRNTTPFFNEILPLLKENCNIKKEII